MAYLNVAGLPAVAAASVRTAGVPCRGQPPMLVVRARAVAGGELLPTRLVPCHGGA